MLLYILRRILIAISVVAVTLIASFALFYVAPTDPAGVLCGERCTPARYEEIRRSLNLDEPLPSQVGNYFKGLVVGRTYESGGTTVECEAPCLGYSYLLGQPVTKLFAQAIPVTFSLVLGGAIVYVSVGLLAGVFAARRRGTLFDRVTVGVSLILNSIPYFIVALIISLYATFLPPTQYTKLFENPAMWASGLLAAWLCLGLANAASYTRYSRGSMIESLGEDFVRTARAKGLTERKVVYGHGLRAALTPVASILGVDLAYQLTNTVFTETIFGLPGVGLMTLRAFFTFDLPVLMGGVLVGSIALVTMNLIVDVLYTVLDPRVRLS
ncbi:ABC transporter permease [Rhizomonospora bruguierae]|uniref:ABC transporter permease n=1 Tax=Rhizomonospora bruguierae TaxID=1581705 RepID=UPI001BCE7DAA|nr:ABC transporter permease [Micromonospora sp. NBRC 107566]